MKARTFLNLLKLVNTVNYLDVPIAVVDENLEIKTLDPTHVEYIRLTIPFSSFDSFKNDMSKEKRLLNVELIVKNIKNCGKNDEVNIEANDESFIIKIESPDNTEMHSFKFTDLEIDDEIPEPRLTFNSINKIETKKLYEALSKMRDYDNVKIISSNRKLILKATSEIRTTELVFTPITQELLTDIVSAKYDLNRLYKVISILKNITDIIEVSYSTNKPLKLSVLDSEFSIIYYLAPLIDENENEIDYVKEEYGDMIIVKHADGKVRVKHKT
ncbi:MAG: hypothetical protein QXT31_03485 [Candidatus Bathyarchaeia archaeon]